jgi:2-C-methyl-D-erythritol 4-phosphate cytidylyltransferase
MHPDRVAVIIPAAGSGSRLGANEPKAFVHVDGLSLLARSAQTLSAVANTIVVAAPQGRLEDALRELSEVDADIHVVEGGLTRQSSIQRALDVLDHDVDAILVHDAARALIPTAMLERIMMSLSQGVLAVVPVLPVVDTIREVKDDLAGAVIDRTQLRRMQTPQGFAADTLRDAYAKATLDATDDAALVQALGIAVHFVEGDERALKVTTPNDIVVLNAYLKEPQ